MPASSTLTLSQAADELGVAPARVRSLVASGAVPSLGSNLVSASPRQVREELDATRDELRASVEALTGAHQERAGLRAELAVLQAQPVGLFRRRRRAGSPAPA